MAHLRRLPEIGESFGDVIADVAMCDELKEGPELAKMNKRFCNFRLAFEAVTPSLR